MRTVRIWINKEGRARYISHLDLNRCFARAVRRAGLKLWYTEGFNPHPYLNFLTPLSLGQESETEPLDIKIESGTTDSEIFESLSHILPEGITIKRVCEPICPASEIAAAEYKAVLEFESAEKAASFIDISRRAISSGTLFAEKHGKKGKKKAAKKINVCDGVLFFDAADDGKDVRLKMTLSAGNTSSLNPSLLLGALENESGIKADFSLIRRIRLLKADGTDFE
jgi:radical SAM-linked protein